MIFQCEHAGRRVVRSANSLNAGDAGHPLKAAGFGGDLDDRGLLGAGDRGELPRWAERESGGRDPAERELSYSSAGTSTYPPIDLAVSRR